MSLSLPEPLGIETDLSVGSTGLEAPDLDNVLPVMAAADFRTVMQGGDSGPFGFRDMMRQMSEGDAEGGGAATGTRADVVAYAKKFLGMQYKWGGSNPNTSFDCSGFTKYVLGHFGVNIPRVSYQQAGTGKRTGLDSLEAGDLVFWDNSSRNNGADHVALYIGGGQIMEFYSTGKPSRIRKVSGDEGAWGVKINYGKG